MPNVQDDTALEAAKARVRSLEQRMGFGCGVIVMMAAGDSPEQKRAAWRARNERRKNRKKNSLGRVILEDVPHDVFIGAMLELGIYVRPVGRSPSFKAALKAFEDRVRNAPPFTRVTVRPLRAPAADERVGSNEEPALEHDEQEI